jgi:hypothetical protein
MENRTPRSVVASCRQIWLGKDPAPSLLKAGAGLID